MLLQFSSRVFKKAQKLQNDQPDLSNKNLILNITLMYTSVFSKQKAVTHNKNQIPLTVQQSESHTTGSVSVISLYYQAHHFNSGVKMQENQISQGLKFNCQKYA
jgi:hypothetical protein